MSLQEELQNAAPAKLLVEHVTKTYRGQHQTVHALEDVSLSVNEGEFVCLLGPSGCGKSTLLNLIAGLEHPDEGSISADGEPVEGPGRQRMVMFQEHALFPWLDVTENVLFGLNLKPHLTKNDRLGVARAFLEIVGLTQFARSSIHELSGGMRQRVALARTLAPNPQVLCMDEPFAALDAMTREQLYDDLQKIQHKRRKTVIFVTHNVREAVCLGDRVLLFTPRPGKIRGEYKIDLPRPRDINDVEVAQLASTITTELKNLLQTTPV